MSGPTTSKPTIKSLTAEVTSLKEQLKDVVLLRLQVQELEDIGNPPKPSRSRFTQSKL
jgi:hypothetical protein